MIRSSSSQKKQILEITKTASVDPSSVAQRVRDMLLVELDKVELPTGKLGDLSPAFFDNIRAEARARKTEVLAAEA